MCKSDWGSTLDCKDPMDEVACGLMTWANHVQIWGRVVQAAGTVSAKALGAGMDSACSRRRNKGDCRGTVGGGEVKEEGRDQVSTISRLPVWNAGLPAVCTLGSSRLCRSPLDHFLGCYCPVSMLGSVFPRSVAKWVHSLAFSSPKISESKHFRVIKKYFLLGNKEAGPNG